jgi:hypothetical protein
MDDQRILWCAGRLILIVEPVRQGDADRRALEAGAQHHRPAAGALSLFARAPLPAAVVTTTTDRRSLTSISRRAGTVSTLVRGPTQSRPQLEQERTSREDDGTDVDDP